MACKSWRDPTTVNRPISVIGSQRQELPASSNGREESIRVCAFSTSLLVMPRFELSTQLWPVGTSAVLASAVVAAGPVLLLASARPTKAAHPRRWCPALLLPDPATQPHGEYALQQRLARDRVTLRYCRPIEQHTKKHRSSKTKTGPVAFRNDFPAAAWPCCVAVNHLPRIIQTAGRSLLLWIDRRWRSASLS